MAEPVPFDVLVIGSGASGLAAAVSADARRRPRRRRREGLAPVVQLGEGAGRDPGGVRRGRLARAARAGRLELEPRDGRHAARRDADERGAERDPLARGARRRVHARQRRLPARPLRRRVGNGACSRSATAPATRSRRRCARHGRRARHVLRELAAPRARADRERLARDASASTSIDAGTVVLSAGGRCYRVAQERGELSTNHPGATGEVTRDRDRPRRRDPRPRRAPVPPERRRVAGEHAGLLDPRDDARVRRRAR